jgi:hypothetical protein
MRKKQNLSSDQKIELLKTLKDIYKECKEKPSHDFLRTSIEGSIVSIAAQLIFNVNPGEVIQQNEVKP